MGTQAILSSLVALILMLCYWGGTDTFAALTIYPPILWSIPFFFLLCFRFRGLFRVIWMPLILWGLMWVLFDDTFDSVLHAIRKQPSTSSKRLSIASLNCEAGSLIAARAALATDADLILLQESPSQDDLEKLAKEKWGDGALVVKGPDAAILCKGKLVGDTSTSLATASALILLDDFPGQPIHVTSIRLSPPVFHLNYFSGETWRSYAANHKQRESDLLNAIKLSGFEDTKYPVVFGGDLNSPPTQGVTHVLEPALNDAFEERGVGWPGTATADFPLVRIDQVWTSRLDVVSCRTQSASSDHKMILVEVDWNYRPTDAS